VNVFLRFNVFKKIFSRFFVLKTSPKAKYEYANIQRQRHLDFPLFGYIQWRKHQDNIRDNNSTVAVD